MATYTFVGFPVNPNQMVNVPDSAIIVGANFSVQNQWQIMCLVPIPEAPAPHEAGTEEPKAETEEEPEGDDTEEDKADADVPPKP